MASRTSTSASVPLATPTERGTPRYAAASSSKAFTFGPRMKTPASSTSARRSFSAGSSEAYCALTSTSGIWGTAAQSRRANPANYVVRHDQHDRGRNGVLDETEVAMEALPARSEPPASPREPEAPGNAAEEGQDGEARDRHSRNAGRDRDERTDDRRHPAEEDGG